MYWFENWKDSYLLLLSPYNGSLKIYLFPFSNMQSSNRNTQYDSILHNTAWEKNHWFFAFNIKEKELLKTSHLSKSAKITVNQGWLAWLITKHNLIEDSIHM